MHNCLTQIHTAIADIQKLFYSVVSLLAHPVELSVAGGWLVGR